MPPAILSMYRSHAVFAHCCRGMTTLKCLALTRKLMAWTRVRLTISGYGHMASEAPPHPQNPLYYLVHVAKIALPLYPQFGTQPNVYYIPPRWVPRNYLEQMFGPGVQSAIDAYTNPSRETLAVLQLFRATQEIVFSYKIEQGPKTAELTIAGQKRELFNDTVVGFDSNGKEIVRVSVDEPLIERPDRFTLNTI